MSGFQIPGLGFAKPNESLPPLPPDVLAAAASFEGIETSNGAPDQKQEQKQEQNEDTTMGRAPPKPSPPMRLRHTAQDASAPQPAEGAAAEQPPAEGEHPEWEIDSSPYESSSESSSDDSSSDEESEAGGYQLLGVEETARMLMEMEGGSDDEGGNEAGKAGASGHLRTKNEMAVENIPKPDVTLTADDKIEQLGLVDQIVENIMVVKAFTPGEYQVLDTGSVLCTEDRKVFGVVWETIGKVLQPMYTVMLSTAEEIKEAGLAVGTKVYYPPTHAKFVFTQPLKNLKGSDASNIHDEEVAEDEMEFSDDEKEAEHKKQIKQKKKEARFGKGGAEGRGRGGREPHPLRNEVSAPSVEGGLNYDDEDDGPYKPLARPPGFGQVPPTQQNFTTEPEPGRFGGRRGGRGDFRGRGDRGRGGRGRGRGGYGGRGDHRDGYSAPPHQRHHSSQQEGSQQQPQGQWGGNNNNNNNNNGYQAPPPPPPQSYNPQQTAPAPTAPAFNFPFPGLPAQPGQQGFPAVRRRRLAGRRRGAYINPAFFAALLGQMQQNQGQQSGQQQQQQQQGQQPPQQPPQPPHQWGAQPPPR
ncbi:H/ACA ribonucleoprotein complex non-core subunit NAF1 [Colletotrichum liriopes]|uniref:H/ACA ribonucleoprotein complex non-core subunit NAF1 n=1 Tax=Colletotrichum liriopes TaxID=708192 RepID=A0AA37LNA5_9PEZI|nr:H/ACA ribonucleoprotein complex non-core subunit NAF1 [Colletotrichum liriopes]